MSLIYPRHCADALLSMANNNTVVGQIASALADFASLWVQSPSSYDFLIGHTMRGDWTATHKPVLSMAGVHTLYTTFKISEPDGKLVICHRSCGAAIKAKVRKNNVRFTCSACGSTCSTQKFTSNKATLLGHYGLVKTAFPQEQYPTEWALPTPIDGGQGFVAMETNISAVNSPHPNPSNAPQLPSAPLDPTATTQYQGHRLHPSTSEAPPTSPTDPLPPTTSRTPEHIPPTPSTVPLLRSSSLPHPQQHQEPPHQSSSRSSPRLIRPQSIPLLRGSQATKSLIPSRFSSLSQTRASKRGVDKEPDVKKKRPKTK